jgi:BirA family biotin operon repressor/biotin-[acetyl-CoA-carboxylase] ligase
LYLSWIIKKPDNVLRLAPLVGALATRQAVAILLPETFNVAIKWPNDIEIGDKKVAGILTELISDPTPHVILGIGVNLNMQAEDFPDNLRRPACSLQQICGQPVDIKSFATILLDALDIFCKRSQEAPHTLVSEFANYCITLQNRVRVSIPGKQPFVGIACEIGKDGNLIVTDDQGTIIEVQAGDVDPID